MKDKNQQAYDQIKFKKNKKGNIRNPYGAMQKLINEILRWDKVKK